MKRILNYSFQFGLIGTLAYLVFFFLIYFMVANPLSYKAAPMGLQLIIVLYSIWYYKSKQSGYLHFYEAFTIGLVVNFIIALLSGLVIFGFIELIDSKPFTVWVSESIKFLNEDRINKKEIMSDETFQKMISSLKNSKPYSIILDRLMSSFWLVFLIGLFGMAFRKVRPLT